jgi:hypothetical protein
LLLGSRFPLTGVVLNLGWLQIEGGRQCFLKVFLGFFFAVLVVCFFIGNPMRIAPATEKCIFCPNSADSGEHLFSRWLRKKFPYGPLSRSSSLSATYEATHPGAPIKETYVRHRRHKRAVNTIQHYVVCKDCNLGWMSRHESRVKDILLALIEMRPISLRRAQIRILERWIAKTVAINEMGYPGVKTVIPSDLALIKRYRNLTKNWKIYIGRNATEV